MSADERGVTYELGILVIRCYCGIGNRRIDCSDYLGDAEGVPRRISAFCDCGGSDDQFISRLYQTEPPSDRGKRAKMSFFSDLFAKQCIWEIQPRLFILSALRDMEQVKATGINYMLDLEVFRDRDIAWLTYYAYWPIKDEPGTSYLPDEWELTTTAGNALEWWQKGATVGIHCKFGRNRSALLMGEVLRLSGMSGPEAVRLIRERRPGALSNDTFREYLERG